MVRVTRPSVLVSAVLETAMEEGGCRAGLTWLREQTDIATAWWDCPSPQWILWLAFRLGVPTSRILAGVVTCAELALPLTSEAQRDEAQRDVDTAWVALGRRPLAESLETTPAPMFQLSPMLHAEAKMACFLACRAGGLATAHPKARKDIETTASSCLHAARSALEKFYALDDPTVSAGLTADRWLADALRVGLGFGPVYRALWRRRLVETGVNMAQGLALYWAGASMFWLEGGLRAGALAYWQAVWEGCAFMLAATGVRAALRWSIWRRELKRATTKLDPP